MVEGFFAESLKRSMICLAIIFAVGMLTEYIFGQYDKDYFAAGLWALALYTTAKLCLWLVDAAGTYISIAVVGTKNLESMTLNELRANKAPYPRPWDAKTHDYLADLADDDDESAADRVKAMAMSIGYKTAINNAPFYVRRQITDAVNNAILRYSAEAPAS